MENINKFFSELPEKKRREGFTILEVIFSITIITLAIGALLTLVSFSISAVPTAQQKLIAAYLAQEGVEVVRNIRDSNWLKDINWKSGIPLGDWEVEYQSASLAQPYGGNFLKLDANSYYNYSSGSQTTFKRKVSVSDNPDGDGASEDILVKSEVSWQNKGRNYSVAAESWLYNWK